MQQLMTRIARTLRSPRGALGFLVTLILGTVALALAPGAIGGGGNSTAGEGAGGPSAFDAQGLLTASLSREHYPRRSSCRVETGSCIWICILPPPQQRFRPRV